MDVRSCLNFYSLLLLPELNTSMSAILMPKNSKHDVKKTNTSSTVSTTIRLKDLNPHQTITLEDI
jgi:hypothetical protein